MVVRNQETRKGKIRRDLMVTNDKRADRMRSLRDSWIRLRAMHI